MFLGIKLALEIIQNVVSAFTCRHNHVKYIQSSYNTLKTRRVTSFFLAINPVFNFFPISSLSSVLSLKRIFAFVFLPSLSPFNKSHGVTTQNDYLRHVNSLFLPTFQSIPIDSLSTFKSVPEYTVVKYKRSEEAIENV